MTNLKPPKVLVAIRFDSAVLFRTDSAVIRTEGQRVLAQAAGVLLEYPKTAVVVQGHTDSTGTEEHNLGLSERRAQAARVFLEGEGVGATRMSALGYGEGYPVAENNSAWGRQQNRRVELLLKAKAR